MKHNLMLCGLLFLMLEFQALFAQKPVQMKLIPGGSFMSGGGYQYMVDGYSIYYIGKDADFEEVNSGAVAIGEVPAPNNPLELVAIASFMLSPKEVTNLEHRNYLVASVFSAEEALGFRKALKTESKKKSPAIRALWEPVFEKAADAGILPDASVWTTDFVFAANEPLTKNYLWHPAFDSYPVVGLTWAQAAGYCEWLSAADNAVRAKKGLAPEGKFRLPTEMEWEYAALGRGERSASGANEQPRYPWHGMGMIDEKGRYRANIKTDHGDYIGDNYEYTAPVGTFSPNRFGLHDMAGNVAEWTADGFQLRGEATKTWRPEWEAGTNETDDPGLMVVKGGSWADYKYASQCGSRTALAHDQASSRVGFRVARSVSE